MTRTLRRLSWAAVGAWAVLLLCHEWFGPDIWYHLYLGERILRTHAAQPPELLLLRQPGFVNLYWLFQLVVRGSYACGGIYAVSLLFILVWSVAGAAWLRTAGLLRAGGLGTALALVAVLVCQTRFEQRPEILSYAFLALQIAWLTEWKIAERPPAWSVTRFIAVQLLWSNMHGYFAFGPLLVGLRLATGLAEIEPGQPLRRQPGWIALWALFGLTLAASLASPFGLRNWEEVAVLWHFFGAMHHQIQEFLPPAEHPQIDLWSIRLFWAYWLGLLGAGLWMARRVRRPDWFPLLLAAVGLYLSAQAVRNLPLVVFFGGPLIGRACARRKERERGETMFRCGLIGAAGALAIWTATGGFHRFLRAPGGFGIRESALAYPIAFADYARATDFSGTVFNSPMDGGYLEFHCPALRIYGDSRFTDPALVAEYFQALRRASDFGALQQREAFDAVLLPIVDSQAVILALLRDSHWELAYADSARAFLVNRQTSVGAAVAIRAPQFYHGENLAIPRNAQAAIEWTRTLGEANDRKNLLAALRQFSAAPGVPSGIIEIALRAGAENSDPEIAAAARALRPKMLPASTIDRQAVDWLLRPEVL